MNPYYVITSFTNGDKVSKHYYMGTQRVATDLGVTYTSQSSSSESTASNSSENTMTSSRTSEGSGSIENTLTINIMNIIGQTSSDTLKKLKFSNMSLEQAYPETSPLAPQEIPQYGGEDPGGYTPQGRILYWYHPDYIQNVDLITDIDGAAYELFLYNPWGEQLHHWTSSSSSWTSPYRFNAKELDPETGLSYYGARYYQSKLGVWLSVDPLDNMYFKPYVFLGNNTMTFVDPDGRRLKIANQATYQLLLLTLPSNIRSMVKVNSKGFITMRSLRMAANLNPQSENLRVLKRIVQDKRTVELDATQTKFESLDTKTGKTTNNSFSAPTRKNDFQIEIEKCTNCTSEELTNLKTYMASFGVEDKIEVSGNLGITLPPKYNNEFKTGQTSVSSNFEVFINPVETTQLEKVGNIGHELYGHVYFFLIGKYPWHGKGGTGERNSELELFIQQREIESIQNAQN